MKLKRIFDLTFSLLLLFFLLPMMIFIALLIFFKIGRPVLFIQERPGLHGKAFKLIKFRTMSLTSEEKTDNSDENRLYPFGRFLRSTSLDELPELWNIIKGEMSLVGPRPLLMEYLPLYNSRQLKRHSVRPGLTGWAQINGRNSLSWQHRFELDLWYVKNQNFFLDLKILCTTFIQVIKRKDISEKGRATMTKFEGNK